MKNQFFFQKKMRLNNVTADEKAIEDYIVDTFFEIVIGGSQEEREDDQRFIKLPCPPHLYEQLIDSIIENGYTDEVMEHNSLECDNVSYQYDLIWNIRLRCQEIGRPIDEVDVSIMREIGLSKNDFYFIISYRLFDE